MKNKLPGMYYTPKELLTPDIYTDTGGFMKRLSDWILSLFVNPPYRGGE